MRAALLAPALLVAFAACSGGEPASPLEQVRTLIAEAEAAAEAKDADALVALLAEDYAGDAGDVGRGPGLGGPFGMGAYRHTRAGAAGVIRAVLGAYRQVHLLTRVEDLALTDGDEHARATVFVALSGYPVSEPKALASLDASLYRFDVAFAREGEAWRVTEARWQRARPADFF